MTTSTVAVASPSSTPSDGPLRRGGIPVTREQATIVDSVARNPLTVVAAGAGTGKTHTTVAAVLELVEQRLATVDQFALITFTNKAADELRARVERALIGRATAAEASDRPFWRDQVERLSGATIRTIHGFSADVLKVFGYDAAITRNFTVATGSSRLTAAAKDAVEQALTGGAGTGGAPDDIAAVQCPPYELQSRATVVLTAIHNRGLDSRTIRQLTEAQPEDAGKRYRVAMARLVEAIDSRYAEIKREDSVVDQHDLLVATADLLEGAQGAWIARRLAEMYPYLFVDEFQDTDLTQKRIVDALSPALRATLVVGDRKQSIYGFRGAESSLLSKIAVENGVPVLPLRLSRRPTPTLLAAQNEFFAVLRRRFPGLDEPLEPPLGPGDAPGALAPVAYVNAGDVGTTPDQRIDATAQAIGRILGAKIADRKTGLLRSVAPGDIAILARSQRAVAGYEVGLRERHGLEVRKDEGGLFFLREEIVSTYRLLYLLLHYPDDTALSLALATPYFRDVDPTAREQYILQYGSTEGSPLTDWFESEHPNISGRLRELRDAVRTDTVPQLLARAYRSFGIAEYYREARKEQAVANLERLRELARQLFGTDQALTLSQFVDWLRLGYQTGREESEAPLGPEDAGPPTHIRIMTIHAAKGLEFPVVIIPETQRPLASPTQAPEFLVLDEFGLDIDLPVGESTWSDTYLRSLGDQRLATLEEEMRLLYVAVTRAENAVIFVGSGSRTAPPNLPESDYYSWRDEIRRAWRALEPLGAQVWP